MSNELKEDEFIRRQDGIHGMQDYIFRRVIINTGLFDLSGNPITRVEEHCIGARIQNPTAHILITKIQDQPPTLI